MSITADLELATVLERITAAAKELVGARYAALGVLDPSGTYLSEFITVGLDEHHRQLIGELPKGHGILGLLILDPKPLRLPDLNEHPDSFGFPLHHPHMRGFLGVPLFIRGEVFGNLYLTDKEDDDGFSDIDEELAVSLAAAAAITIDNARLHDKIREHSLLADRERIAHDLHDTVIQRLFATGMALQGTSRLIERDDIAARIHQHIDDLDETIRHIRSVIFELDTPRLPGDSTRRDILEVIAEAARALGFDPSTHLEGPIDLHVNTDIAAHLLAVLREALSNATRHANARRIDVRVTVGNDLLLLEVQDDGIGIPTHTPTAGNGIRNITTRATTLGGSTTLQPAQPRGTLLRWSVPLT
jgi:signal transduction histidine kinase